LLRRKVNLVDRDFLLHNDDLDLSVDNFSDIILRTSSDIIPNKD